MELIDRYLFEVGHHLSPAQRADILSELRSSLEDALEASADGTPDEADVIALLKEMGRPRDVAASYYPEGQYLIGPTLYPLFRMVVVIVLSAVIGAQLLVVLLSLLLSSGPVSAFDSLWEIIGSVPMALGSVVLVFALLQREGVTPEWESETWDPSTLPPVDEAEPVKQGELVFELLVATMVLVGLTRIAYGGGFDAVNPLFARFFPWIALSMVISIVVDVVLLWKGRWSKAVRLAKLGDNLFSIVVLVLLVQGHAAWLAAHGSSGWFVGFTRLPELLVRGPQLAGVAFFHSILIVVLIATLAETGVQLFRLIRSYTRGGPLYPINATA